MAVIVKETKVEVPGGNNDQEKTRKESDVMKKANEERKREMERARHPHVFYIVFTLPPDF